MPNLDEKIAVKNTIRGQGKKTGRNLRLDNLEYVNGHIS